MVLMCRLEWLLKRWELDLMIIFWIFGKQTLKTFTADGWW